MPDKQGVTTPTIEEMELESKKQPESELRDLMSTRSVA